MICRHHKKKNAESTFLTFVALVPEEWYIVFVDERRSLWKHIEDDRNLVSKKSFCLISYSRIFSRLFILTHCEHIKGTTQYSNARDMYTIWLQKAYQWIQIQVLSFGLRAGRRGEDIGSWGWIMNWSWRFRLDWTTCWYCNLWIQHQLTKNPVIATGWITRVKEPVAWWKSFDRSHHICSQCDKVIWLCPGS